MKRMFLEPFIWLAILGVLDFFTFLVRGFKVIRWRIFSRLFISLSCICAALILFPRNVPVKLIQFFASAMVVIVALAIIIDFFTEVFLKFKNNVLAGINFDTPLPGYLMEVCRAMQIIAQRKLGALIILEKKEKLEGCIDGGIAFDAQVKAEILAALFAKTSPVHDGAVIITNGRIRRVKAILSISPGSELPAEVGTRHRSATGITTMTDAIALVVSEERAELSIAYRGDLVKVDSNNELHRLIKTALRGKSIAPAVKQE